MTSQSGLFRACCAQVWRGILLTAQAMARWDLTGQLTGWAPPQDGDVPDGWAAGTLVGDAIRAVVTAATSHAAPERPRGFTPAELARLRVLCARYHARRVPFTPCEVAHLHFVRWLHQTGRLTS
jgi:hypothetical protein